VSNSRRKKGRKEVGRLGTETIRPTPPIEVNKIFGECAFPALDFDMIMTMLG
jgi:hypothetical protein